MRIHRSLQVITLALAVAGLGLIPPLTAEESSSSRLTFIKVFKGSFPEYIRVTVDEDGHCSYAGGSADQPEAPESFRLSSALTARLFALVAELNYFQGLELEMGKRVASMGKKTFIYEKAGQRAEVSYNYTRNATADELRGLFEGIARGRHLIRQLEHRLIFDRLGLMDALRAFERDFNAGRLVDLEQFVPVLEKVAADPRLMKLARTRAQELLQRLRGAPARLQLEFGDQNTGGYYKIVLVEAGSVMYEARRFAEPPNPQPLTLPQPVVKRLWELARLANYFRDLKDYRELAGRLSGYRFTYQDGAKHQAVAFSVSPTPVVAEMVHIFQQALQQEHYRSRLRTALEEKSLMLQVVLQELETAVSRDKLLDPGEFAPLLEGIANGDEHHSLVREKAESLLARIRALGE